MAEIPKDDPGQGDVIAYCQVAMIIASSTKLHIRFNITVTVRTTRKPPGNSDVVIAARGGSTWAGQSHDSRLCKYLCKHALPQLD